MARANRARLSAAEGRRFGLTVGLAFLALGTLLWWREREMAASVAAGIGVALMLSGLALPTRLGPVHGAWMRVALALSKITTPILMALVYFLVITPIGLIRRAMGKSPIAARDTGSRWESRGAHSRSDLNRQF